MKWYYVQDGQQRGPIFTSELAGLSASGELADTSLIWREGLTAWTPLAALRDELPGSKPAEPEPETPEPDIYDSPYRPPRSALPEPAAPPVDRGIPAIFRHAGTLFFQRFWPLMISYLIVWAPLNFLMEYAYYEFGRVDDIFLQLRLRQLADAMIGVIALGSVFSICESTWKGDSPGLGWALSQGLVNYGRLFVARFLGGCCILAGFILFIGPGIWIWVRLMFLESVVISEKLSGTEALRRAWDLSRDQFWPLLGYFLLGLMVWFMALTVVETGYVALPQDNWLAAAGADCLMAVPQVFLAVFTFVVYKHRLAVWEAASRARNTHPV